ncbi:MAG: DUF4430 domain-containing protein [Chloroflexi bacterium]|nr:DUF4430 domain-containing protein [Chloroflexota bacterium]
MRRYRLLAIALLLPGISALSACSAQPSAVQVSQASVRVVATRNFGQELIFDKLVQSDAGISALDALRRVAEVETSYGGGFVSAINGVRSEFGGANPNKRDWFFYVNGFVSSVGAADYRLRAGDIEQWDFHGWSFHTFIPATIGAFPETFTQEFQGRIAPTLIVYVQNLKRHAEDLAKQLSQSGVTSVGIRSSGELSEKERADSNLILLGTTDDELIMELNRNWRRLGLFSYVEDDVIIALNAKGEVSGRYAAAAGLIQATQNPWNPKGIGASENVVWMVTGTDESGVKGAVDVLINHPADLRYAFAAVVIDGRVIKVPQ